MAGTPIKEYVIKIRADVDEAQKQLDTIVEENYFTAITDCFNKGFKAGVTDFEHRHDGSAQENLIITRAVSGLNTANSRG